MNSQWADSIIQSMTLEEKVAQLILLETGKITRQNNDFLKKLISKTSIGGISFRADSVGEHVANINNLQTFARIPMFIGLNSRSGFPGNIKEIHKFPPPLAIEAIQKDTLKFRYGEALAAYCKQLGITFHLFPVLDNSKNPYVKKDEPASLPSAESIAIYSRRLHEKKIISCIKASVYNKMSEIKVGKNHVSHLREGISGIFSEKTMTSGKNTFTGLKIYKIPYTTLHYPKTIKNAIEQGFDIFILSKKEYHIVYRNVIKLYKDNILTEALLDEKVKKILLAKAWTGLNKFQPLSSEIIKKNIEKKADKALQRELYAASVILLKNDKELIPLKNLHKKEFLAINIGKSRLKVFEETLSYYDSVNFLNIDAKDLEKKIKEKKYNHLIISISDGNIETHQKEKLTRLVQKWYGKKELLLINFGDPRRLKSFQEVPTLIQVYDNSKLAQAYAAQLLFGGVTPKSKLPYSLTEELFYQKGVTEIPKIRLKYGIPEEAGLAAEKLAIIDSIVAEGIAQKAMPGCQVWVAVDGNAIYHKAFGYHSYDKLIKVKKSDLYDIASITKVAGTTLAAMKMYDEGNLSLDKALGTFFKNTEIRYNKLKADTVLVIDTLKITDTDSLKHLFAKKDTFHLDDSTVLAIDTLIYQVTPKQNIFKTNIRELLLHKSGISPSLPILPFIQIIDSTEEKVETYYCDIKDNNFCIKLATNLYLRFDHLDTLWDNTKQMRVYSKKPYQYSDANMVILQKAIDSINGHSIEKYLFEKLYNPLGLQNTCYNPVRFFKKERIVPTEKDIYWRKQLVHGYVHDPTAALLGGVAGNAGIFTNANDLGVLFQMLLDKGYYGGKQYLKASTVDLFTSRQPGSHRGLGFDMPSPNAIIAPGASYQSFGHTGFTGTCVWVDPDKKIVFVFLSNRVHPSAKNYRINRLKIRQRIHQAIYDAMKTQSERLN